jgi:hypothetical protein
MVVSRKHYCSLALKERFYKPDVVFVVCLDAVGVEVYTCIRMVWRVNVEDGFGIIPIADDLKSIAAVNLYAQKTEMPVIEHGKPHHPFVCSASAASL